MKRIFPVSIAATIISLFCINSAFGQCGLPGTPPCPEKPRPVPTPVTPKPKQPKKPPAIVTKPQTRFVHRAPEIELVRIPSGSFMMGSNSSVYDDEKPAHHVNINYSFYIGKFEITQSQWKAVMGKNPSYILDCGDDCPVEQVSWNDAQEFIRKLNNLQNDIEYRLPTEAEWEYAYRAGTTGDYYGSLNAIAWYDGNTGKSRKHSVGQQQPNAFGLYDMSGNVAEWCQDWYGTYPVGTVTNPTGAISGTYRVTRGGGWVDSSISLRSSARQSRVPSLRYSGLGFRVAARIK